MAIDKIRSKYQAKNYEERTYNLEECVCYKCGHVFMLDTNYCPTRYDETIFDDVYRVICPYCGKKWESVL